MSGGWFLVAHLPALDQEEGLPRLALAENQLAVRVNSSHHHLRRKVDNDLATDEDGKGGFVDVTGDFVDVKGGVVDVKGGVVDVKGDFVDVKGGVVDVKGGYSHLGEQTGNCGC
eukprot:9391072-Pyramimonas_sp.AAC.2